MIKRVCIYSLPEGADGDEFWKWHTKEHSIDIIKASSNGLKKYVVNRVTKVVRGKQICYGFVETWWESEEAAQKCFEGWKSTDLEEGNTLEIAWWDRLASGFSFAVEEYEVPVEDIQKSTK